ncbi:MAG: hypothetical protein ABSG74_09650 [Candidatus Bathyarchaeia archaeon]
MSDVDLQVVARSFNPQLEKMVASIVRRYQESLRVKMSAGVIPFRNYRTQKKLDFYDAKKTGRVIFGDESILDTISMRDPRDIPLWEGLRLLFNRIFGLLENLDDVQALTYDIAKVYLAIGEADLVSHCQYRPTCRERLVKIMDIPELAVLPGFRNKFRVCSEFKLNERNDINGLSLQNAIEEGVLATSHFLTHFLERPVSLKDGIEILSRKFYNPLHAGMYLGKKLLEGKRIRFSPTREPCLVIWKNGIELLQQGVRNKAFADELLDDWKHIPQYVLR